MKILTTKTPVNNLAALQRRKAELKTCLDVQQAELKSAWQEVRADLQPARIAERFAQSLLGDDGASGGKGPAYMPGALRFAGALLIGNTRTRLLFNLIAPFAVAYLPRIVRQVKGISLNKTKRQVYGSLRKGVAGLRSQLKRRKNPPEEAPAEEIIQPS
jgi:hypothetical protein